MKKVGTIFALLGAVMAGRADETIESNAIAARVPNKETGAEKDHLTGNWGGWRDQLVEKGVHLQAGYTGEVLGNVEGGTSRRATYEGLLELSLEIDLAKAGLWKHGLFHISSLYPHGASLSRKYVGELQTLSNIDAYDSFRLYELWHEARFFQEKASVRLGQLTADEEFSVTESSLDFINSAFGWPLFISANTVNTGPAFFVATPGLRVRYEEEKWFGQAGIFDGDSFDSPSGDPRVNANGAHIHMGGAPGFFSMGEIGYRKKEKLPGLYRIGAWLHTGQYSDNYYAITGGATVLSGLPPATHSHNFGAYFSAEQTVWRENGQPEAGDRGLTVFFRGGGSPPDRSLIQFACTGGLNYKGLIPGRNEDTIALGVAFAKVSHTIRKAERDNRDRNGVYYAALSDYEVALESFYSIKVTPAVTIQPDLQWIIHPGGSSAIDDAVVLGLRAILVF